MPDRLKNQASECSICRKVRGETGEWFKPTTDQRRVFYYTKVPFYKDGAVIATIIEGVRVQLEAKYPLLLSEKRDAGRYSHGICEECQVLESEDFLRRKKITDKYRASASGEEGSYGLNKINNLDGKDEEY